MASDILSEGLGQLGLKVDTYQLSQLSSYLQLIQKWNQAYNLTAIKNLSKMRILHLLDSASCYSFIQGPLVLDVGTGAGLPGVVLAILNPNLNVTLLDSNSKKIRFLRQCKLELALDNIHPIHCRIEDVDTRRSFNSVVSRAFASFDDFANNCSKLLTTNGILVAMKGKWDETTQYKVVVNQISVPFLEAKRHIVTHEAISIGS